jgi:ArsR family metal-binding transcriptional regulator
MPIGFLLSTITLIALYETGSIHWSGKLGIVAAIFFTPSFLYKLYLMYDRRDRLVNIYEFSKLQMRAIKMRDEEKKRLNSIKNNKPKR